MAANRRTPSTAALESSLHKEGLEVFRTVGDELYLADRARENLLLDSGVRVRSDHGLVVSFNARALQADFPEEARQQLFARARRVGQTALSRGYVEVREVVTELTDRADPSRTLDTWYEISFEKRVGDLAAVVAEVRFALAVDKVAERDE